MFDRAKLAFTVSNPRAGSNRWISAPGTGLA